jgi:SAM-dependent methyltransferase
MTKSIPSGENLYLKYFNALASEPNLKNESFLYWNVDGEAVLKGKFFEYFGGYDFKKILCECLEPRRVGEAVLDIGPYMGIETFMLSELYDRVLVTEPNRSSLSLIKKLSNHYTTEDGKKTSRICEFHQAGIRIDEKIIKKAAKENNKTGILGHDFEGADDINNVLGEEFADKIFMNCLFSPLSYFGINGKDAISELRRYLKPGGRFVLGEEKSDLLQVFGSFDNLDRIIKEMKLDTTSRIQTVEVILGEYKIPDDMVIIEGSKTP